MERRIILTEDGSATFFVPELNEHYHSIHGAIRESLHVFIKNGFERISGEHISVLEVGFGTGLNAYLTFERFIDSDRSLYYESWEKFPLIEKEVEELNYPELAGLNPDLFDYLHSSAWEVEVPVLPNAVLKKIRGDIREFGSEFKFDLVYFDAFGPDSQPELWTTEVFKRISACQDQGGLLATYSVKGTVRRNLQEAGYRVSKHPGPPGKREILLAEKT
jgi:tRNA U34 5-methylaminomethyl-2-thiouridine-forming methyltransferase MnmC